MADGFVQVAPDSTGKKIDQSELTVGANTVERQRISISGHTVAAALADVLNTVLAGTEYGLVTRSLIGPMAAPAATTGNITTAATVVGPVTMGLYDGATVTVQGTHAGVNFGFWGSTDNSTWFPVQAVRTDTGIVESTTGVLTTNSARSWDISIGEFLFFRVVATAWTSGSAAVAIQLGMFASESAVAATTQGPAASGTNVAGNPNLIGGSDGTSVRNALVDANGRLLISLATATATMTMKAASTAAATADTALVVSFAPANCGTKIGDGTNNAAIKAASTAAAATDPALVVSLSPNSPIVLPTPTASIINSAATTNATSVKASAGTVYSVTASNTGGAAAFVKLYNLATAPTVGTSTIAITIPVPAGGTVNLSFGTAGARFGTGIGLSITNLGTDADTTAVAAAQVKVITAYI
ncbi:MAG: hypothetical protein AB3X44_16240 [Leptothrix sp. (in: b-proteobacteria)]